MSAIAKAAWPGEVLRELLRRPPILEQPVVCDPFSARLARQAGYQAVALAGYAIGAHQPLTCELSLDDIERAARAVVVACRLPLLLLDADVGWDDTGQVAAAVARLEGAGVAAIGVSGQHVPDHPPSSPAAERHHVQAGLLRRVAIARAARDHALIVARCDVPPGEEYVGALGRAGALLAAGADAIVVHAAEDHLRRLPRDLPGATLICAGPPAGSAGPSVYPARRLEQWGYRAVSSKHHRCYCSRRQGPVEPTTAGRRADRERIS